ncbi:MFS transporter [Alicyclobacillus cycloheptanicus]|uniref:YQGE family putative transporter n=1 Tax=Alicyclobacillus cycloheptanicus TaxID=1457 RepID=A0ABT9XF83_9BACL|nr:MFS transporter [Alicyclobacillus cycloheptanicus]MDQ0188925.1 YQGE family putative transporter [Alicyclobacillus cycloheptanicus]WDM01726.1 MFS transporter [Alicyclobacillus cycloheptanicus]
MRQPRPVLPSSAWWLLVISGIFALSIGLSNTFVNIYLWKVDRSYAPIAWYNLAVYCLMPIAFVAAGAVAKRTHPIVTIRLGVALHGVFYAVILAGGTALAKHPFVPGIFMGIAAGFYWLSFNWLSMLFTGEGTRDRFYGLNGVAGAVSGMIAPFAAGFLIAREDQFGGLSGYHVIFGLSLALFAAATGVSLRLRRARVQAAAWEKTLDWRAALTSVREARGWRLTLLGCAVYGLREGVFLFLIGLLFYVATGSEMKLGEFLLLQSAVSFASFFAMGRFVKAHNRLRWMGVGAAGMAAAALLFTLPLSLLLVVSYGVAIAVFLPFFLVPLQGAVFHQIGALTPEKTDDVEHIIMREGFENLGRVVGIAAFLVVLSVDHSARTIGWFAVALGFVQLGTFALLRFEGAARNLSRKPLTRSGRPQRSTSKTGRVSSHASRR